MSIRTNAQDPKAIPHHEGFASFFVNIHFWVRLCSSKMDKIIMFFRIQSSVNWLRVQFLSVTGVWR